MAMNSLAGFNAVNMQIPGHVRLSIYVPRQLSPRCCSCQVLPVACIGHESCSFRTQDRPNVNLCAVARHAGPLMASQESCCSITDITSQLHATHKGRSHVLCRAAPASTLNSSSSITTPAHKEEQQAGKSTDIGPASSASSTMVRRSSSSNCSNPNSPSSQRHLTLLQQLRAQRGTHSSSTSSNGGNSSADGESPTMLAPAGAAAGITPQQLHHSGNVMATTERRHRQAKLQHLSLPQTDQQQQQQSQDQDSPSEQQQSLAVLDPSALPIMDRVRLIRNRVAAQQSRPTGGRIVSDRLPTNRSRRCSMGELRAQVLSACSAANVGSRASSFLLEHVVNRRIGANSLGAVLRSYVKLQLQYGQESVLQWLRRCPPIFRVEEEVPGRLQQLGHLMGDATLPEVLALTRRCPMVLGVKPNLLEQRLTTLCELLQRETTDGAQILQAAPALLAMDPNTLAVKVRRLELLAALHPKWAQAFRQTPSKNRAVLLTYSLKRQMRLVYLAQTGQHGTSFSISTVMAWSEDKMQGMYPAYAAWYAEHAVAAAAAEEAARAAAGAGVDGSSSAGGSAGTVAAAAATPATPMQVRQRPMHPMLR